MIIVRWCWSEEQDKRKITKEVGRGERYVEMEQKEDQRLSQRVAERRLTFCSVLASNPRLSFLVSILQHVRIIYRPEGAQLFAFVA
jgi:hypothetical protein